MIKVDLVLRTVERISVPVDPCVTFPLHDAPYIVQLREHVQGPETTELCRSRRYDIGSDEVHNRITCAIVMALCSVGRCTHRGACNANMRVPMSRCDCTGICLAHEGKLLQHVRVRQEDSTMYYIVARVKC